MIEMESTLSMRTVLHRSVRRCIRTGFGGWRAELLMFVFAFSFYPKLLLANPLTSQPPAGASPFARAAAYSRSHGGASLLIMRDGEILFEEPSPATTAHNLYSGTKSFSCVLAVAAADDGLLDLDEPVSETLTEWQKSPDQQSITIRQLLSLTAGIDPGLNGSMPSYGASVRTTVIHAPGSVFQYGPVPFQAFGELMRRKLVPNGETPLAYLKRRVFHPVGLHVHAWRTDWPDNARMPGGAYLTAREWARFGELLLNDGRHEGEQILDADLLHECFMGSAANPGYGLALWLPLNPGINSEELRHVEWPAALHRFAPIIKAAGVGGQRLFVIPSLRLVIVRQSDRRGPFDDALFLSLIIESTLQ